MFGIKNQFLRQCLSLNLNRQEADNLANQFQASGITDATSLADAIKKMHFYWGKAQFDFFESRVDESLIAAKKRPSETSKKAKIENLEKIKCAIKQYKTEKEEEKKQEKINKKLAVAEAEAKKRAEKDKDKVATILVKKIVPPALPVKPAPTLKPALPAKLAPIIDSAPAAPPVPAARKPRQGPKVLPKPAARSGKVIVGSDADKDQFIAKMKEIRSLIKLEETQYSDRFQTGIRSRFTDIPCRKTTSLGEQTLKNGSSLHANMISVGGNPPFAIACQYPKIDQMGDYLSMLWEGRTPCVTVLSTKAEINESQSETSPNKLLPNYFFPHDDKSYPNGIKTSSKLIGKEQFGSLVIDQYSLTISPKGDKKIMIPLLHCTNWPDQMPISALELFEFAQYQIMVTNKRKKQLTNLNSEALKDPFKVLPVLHCKAGVGRTGMMVCEIAMQNESNSFLSLEEILSDIRYSRSGAMVQSAPQMDVIVQRSIEQKRLLNHVASGINFASASRSKK